MSPKLETVKTISDIVSVWVGLVALLGAGIFALLQYVEKQSEDRVKVSIDFLHRYGDSEVGAARTRLREVWRKHRIDFEAILNKQIVSNEEYSDFIMAVVERESLQEPISYLIDYFDSLNVCVEKKICDSETTRALLKRDADSFFNLHYPVIVLERSSNPNFASSLQAFAKSP